MRVILGKTLDGGTYPTVLTDTEASVGRVHLGPASFLAELEQLLGIPSPSIQEPVRVAQYAKRLVQQNDGKQFYSESREANSWRVARKLLSLRDELVYAGWNGKLQPKTSARLRAFAELEQMANECRLARLP